MVKENIEESLKQEMVLIGRKLWRRGLVAANDGNISVRSGDAILITPTGVSKGFMETGQIIKVTLDGQQIAGERRPSSETQMHLEVYRNRPDIQAALHAHPPFAVTFAVAGEALERKILAEAVVLGGEAPLVPFGLPSTPEVAAGLRPFLPKYDQFLLEFHGALTLGKDLEEAYQRMERLEFYAQIIWNLRVMGNDRQFSPEQLEKLEALRRNFKKP